MGKQPRGAKESCRSAAHALHTLTYRGTENQGDVLVVAHCSERYLWKDVVILGSGERGVQKHNVVLLVQDRQLRQSRGHMQPRTALYVL